MSDPKKPSEFVAWEKWKVAPGPQTLAPLITELDPIITQATHAYGYGDDPNIKNTSKLLVAKALPRYDPSKAALGTFVFGELRRLQRVGPQQEYAIPVTERAMLEKAALRRKEDELLERLGREPTDDEIMDYTGVSAARLTALRGVGHQVVGPRYDDVGNEMDSASQAFDDTKLWTAAVLDTLDPTDRKIYDWSSGRTGPRLSGQQIAARLKISPAAVSQRARRIAIRMAEGSETRL